MRGRPHALSLRSQSHSTLLNAYFGILTCRRRPVAVWRPEANMQWSAPCPHNVNYIFFSMKHDFFFWVKFHTFGLHVFFPPERMAVMSPIPNRKRHIIMSIHSGWNMIGCWGNAAYHVLLLYPRKSTIHTNFGSWANLEPLTA